MFYKNYLSSIKYYILLDTYKLDYLKTIDENKFKEIYELFKKYKFYFIDDIILRYLEIFNLDSKIVEKGILELNKELGNNFVYLIGDDMRLLEKILNYEDDNISEEDDIYG